MTLSPTGLTYVSFLYSVDEAKAEHTTTETNSNNKNNNNSNKNNSNTNGTTKNKSPEKEREKERRIRKIFFGNNTFYVFFRLYQVFSPSLSFTFFLAPNWRVIDNVR